MSQDAHMFSVRRQRETLGAINNNASAIPMPSSAMKRSNSGQNLNGAANSHARSMSGSRMSLMAGRPQQPNFSRSSSGLNAFDNVPMSAQRPGTSMFGGTAASARRSTMAPGLGGSAGLGASTPGSAQVLATPGMSIQRRSSCFSARPSSGPGSGARASFFSTAPPPAGVPQDPRRLRDPNVRQQMQSDLITYLTDNKFEFEVQISLTSKTLSSPTQKEFNVMFQWLYKRIDPGYRFMKSMDAEIPPLLKQLHYPFEKSITKSQIAAVGGNNWHTFLGLLHWLMQLAQMMDAYARGDFDHATAEMGYDCTGDRIIFDFLTNAYQDWLNVPDGADDDAADQVIQKHVDRMAARFKEVGADSSNEVDILEAEKKALLDQIEELEAVIKKGQELGTKLAMLKDDTKNHEEWCGKVEAKIRKYQDKSTRVEEEVRKLDAETEEIKDERQGYQDAIARQGYTIEELDRLVAETERLETAKRQIQDRLDQTKTQMNEKETETAQKLDELERAVERYNQSAYKIGIIPSTAANAHGTDYELALTIRDDVASVPALSASQFSRSQQAIEHAETRLLRDATTGYAPYQLLNHDVKGNLKSQLQALRRAISDRRTRAMEEEMRNNEMLDGVKEALEEKTADVEALEHRLRAAEEEFQKVREMNGTAKVNGDAQIERMEKELARLRGSVGESLQSIEQREIGTNLEYEQLTLRAAALREELHTEIERILNDVIKFKVHIQTNLENHEKFVGEEVDGECEELQRLEMLEGEGEVEEEAEAAGSAAAAVGGGGGGDGGGEEGDVGFGAPMDEDA